MSLGCGATPPGNQVQSSGTGCISTGCPQKGPLPRSPCPRRLKKEGVFRGTPTMSSAEICSKSNSPKSPLQDESRYVTGLDQYAQAHVGNAWFRAIDTCSLSAPLPLCPVPSAMTKSDRPFRARTSATEAGCRETAKDLGRQLEPGLSRSASADSDQHSACSNILKGIP